MVVWMLFLLKEERSKIQNEGKQSSTEESRVTDRAIEEAINVIALSCRWWFRKNGFPGKKRKGPVLKVSIVNP